MEAANQACHDKLTGNLCWQETKVEDQGNSLVRLTERMEALEAAATQGGAALELAMLHTSLHAM